MKNSLGVLVFFGKGKSLLQKSKTLLTGADEQTIIIPIGVYV